MQDKTFFVYGFPKNERDNISQEDEKGFKDLSTQLFDFTANDIAKMLAANVLTEAPYND